MSVKNKVIKIKSRYRNIFKIKFTFIRETKNIGNIKYIIKKNILPEIGFLRKFNKDCINYHIG